MLNYLVSNLNRLNRTEQQKNVGLRLDMKVYDCDNQLQFDQLNNKLGDSYYLGLNLIQSFSPDSIDEAKNRGFKPV